MASGLLTGKFSSDSKFGKDDHRQFNRNGEAFDKGETFSGVNYSVGLQAMEEMKALFPGLENLAPIALQWILQFPEVSSIIPGASKLDHVVSNLSVYDQEQLTGDKFDAMNSIYQKYIKESVHQLW